MDNNSIIVVRCSLYFGKAPSQMKIDEEHLS